MWYLCEKFDAEGKLLPKSLEKRTEVNCWLMFQMGGLGPMQGQAHHFIKVCTAWDFTASNHGNRITNGTENWYHPHVDNRLEWRGWNATCKESTTLCS